MTPVVTCRSTRSTSAKLLTAAPLFAAFLGAVPTIAAAAADSAVATTIRDLADLSLEELMNESITSVAKKEQRLADATAAVYVLTADDILRAGHTSIPEALRMVPGLSVARLDSHTWIITARGFAAQYAGKLLVLIDGRTVYNPFFSGVVWNWQDLMLEDLDRIEIIRGPGATLWGANAVNGVINIISKKARDTQGGLATAGGGPQERSGALRYGGERGNAHYRVYVKADDEAALVDRDGHDTQDAWRMGRAGFRTDWQASDADLFTLQGDLYRGAQNAIEMLTSLTPPYFRTFPDEEQLAGANLLGRWNHTLDERSRWSLQLYYDRTGHTNPMLAIERDTFDIEFQHQLDVGSRHTIVYGAGFRYTQADYADSFFVSYPQDHDSSGLANVFLQDEIALVRDKLSLSIGSKLEHNEFSGLELQPSARLRWTPDRNHSAWASVSRAVRTPNPLESGLRVNYMAFDTDGPGPTPPTLLSLLPNADLHSETLVAYEAGYRLEPSRGLYLDLAAFVNVYDDLVAIDAAGPMLETHPTPTHLTLAGRYANVMRGDTRGIELAPSWQVTDSWKLAGGYTWLQMKLQSDAAGHAGEEQAGDTPTHQFHLRSSMQWPHKLTFDTAVYYVDSLPNQGVSSYVRLDATLGWHPTDRLGVRIGGTNLLDDRHAEFRSYAVVPSQVQRSVYGKVTWQF